MSARCPPEADLLALADGELSGTSLEVLERHVEACADCFAILTDLLREHESQAQPATGFEGDTSAPKTSGPECSPRRPPPKPAAGLRIGRYVLLEQIGAGAMGYVYTAYDPELTRYVALKLIRHRTTKARARGSARARLLREAQAVAQLRHPNVVTIHEVGEASDVDYIAMELIEGETLRSWMSGAARTLSWRGVVDVFVQAGQGLAAAHAAGLLHRDFKPDNVLIDVDGRARVVDFGLVATTPNADTSEPSASAAASAEHSRVENLGAPLTETGSVMGTPMYMAPEQHESARVDASADLYAFCVSLYEALFGERPFHGHSSAELLAAKRGAPPTASSTNRRVPGWLRAVVVRGLAADPAERWASMSALLAALRADPWRRRVVRATVATVGAGVLVAFGTHAYLQHQRAQACASEGAEVYAVWNDATAQELEQAFAATELGYAPDSWRRARAGIDAYVEKYARERAALCIAGERDGTIEPDVLARGRECFDAALASIERTGERWASPTAQTVLYAPTKASTYPALRRCSSIDSLARRVALERVDAPETELATARGLYHDARELSLAAGHSDQVVAGARAAVEAAVTLGAHSLAAAAGVTECSALTTADKIEAATAACQRSYVHAVRAADHEYALTSASALADLAGQRGRDRALASHWLDVVEAHLSFVEQYDAGPSPDRARMTMSRGHLEADTGDLQDAIAHYRAAAAMYHELSGDSSELGAYAWMALSHSAAQLGEESMAANAAQRAFEIRTRVYGPAHPLTLEAERYVAGCMALDQPDAALQIYQRVYDQLVESTGPDGAFTLVTLSEWASMLELSGGCEAARSKAEQAVAAAARQATQPVWLPAVLRIIATCQLAAGDAAAAKQSAEQGLAWFGDPANIPERPVTTKLREVIERANRALTASATVEDGA